jgi:hypothetical protein
MNKDKNLLTTFIKSHTLSDVSSFIAINSCLPEANHSPWMPQVQQDAKETLKFTILPHIVHLIMTMLAGYNLSTLLGIVRLDRITNIEDSAC